MRSKLLNRRAFTAATVVVLWVCGVGNAFAGASSDAEALIRQGIELRRSGDDQAALPLFEKAYTKAHTPRAAAQLGLCEMALGRWPQAETYLAGALRAGSDPWVLRNRAVLENSLRSVKEHVARVEIVGSPPGAHISVNGDDVGTLPLPEPVRVAAGTVEIEARAPGYKRETKQLTVTGAQFQRVPIELERAAESLGPLPAATHDPSADATSSMIARGPDSEGPGQPDQPVYKKAWFWIAVGTLAVASVVTGILVAGQSTDYQQAQVMRTIQ